MKNRNPLDIQHYIENDAAFREFVAASIARLDERSKRQADEIVEIKNSLKAMQSVSHNGGKKYLYGALVEIVRIAAAAVLAFFGVRMGS